MALDFSGGSTAKVDFGTSTSLDGNTAGTWCAWINANAVSDGRIAHKGLFPQAANIFLTLASSPSDIVQASYSRATTDMTVDAALTDFSAWGTSKWVFVAFVWDVTGTTATDQRLYMGDQTTPCAEPSSYSTQDAGTGTADDDSGLELIVGNKENDNTNLDGDIAFFAGWDRQLTLGELYQQQFRPHPTSGCVLMSLPGWDGTGTQRDYSGRGNNGTVTAATLASGNPGIVPGWHHGMPGVAFGPAAGSGTETMAITDSTTEALISPLDPTSVTITDSAQSFVTTAVTATETIAFTDSPAETIDIIRVTATDDMFMSEQLERTIVSTESDTATDTAAFTDTATAHIDLFGQTFKTYAGEGLREHLAPPDGKRNREEGDK